MEPRDLDEAILWQTRVIRPWERFEEGVFVVVPEWQRLGQLPPFAKRAQVLDHVVQVCPVGGVPFTAVDHSVQPLEV
jgi:hypothetical protein